MKISINKLIYFKMDRHSKSEKVKNLLRDILNNSLAQAIIKLTITHHFSLKLFLIACVLASTGLASYLVIDSIITYFNFEVVSQIGIGYELKSKFPAVTICNNKPFTTISTETIYENVFIVFREVCGIDIYII